MAVFPVSLWIKLVKLTINFTRRNGLSKSVGIHDICLGRRLIELHELLNDERVLERDEVNCKLSYLDVGAREGIIEVVRKNQDYFDNMILCEGEARETTRL